MITVFILFAVGLFLIGIVQKVWSDEVYRERQMQKYREEFDAEQQIKIDEYMKGARIIERQ